MFSGNPLLRHVDVFREGISSLILILTFTLRLSKLNVLPQPDQVRAMRLCLWQVYEDFLELQMNFISELFDYFMLP